MVRILRVLPLAVVAVSSFFACSDATKRDSDFGGVPASPGAGGGGGGGGGGSAGATAGSTSGTTAGTTSGTTTGDGGATTAGDGAVAGCTEKTVLVGFTPLRTVYISPTGSDQADGLTPVTPWRSFANSARLRAGDQVDVDAGTYACGVTIAVEGAASNPVWIRAAKGKGTAVLECGNAEFGLWISGAKYLAIDGLVIHGTLNDGLRITAPTNQPTRVPDHIAVLNTRVYDTGGAGIRATRAVSLDLFANDVSRTEAFGARPEGQGIDLVGVKTARIMANSIHDVAGNTGLQIRAASENVLVDGNLFYSVNEALRLGGRSAAVDFPSPTADYEAKNIAAVNNVMFRDVVAPFSVYGCASCLISNSTADVAAAQAALIGASGNTGASAPSRASNTTGLRFINNIVRFTSAPSRIFNMRAEDTVGFVNQNNLFFATTGAASTIASSPPASGDGVIFDRDPLLANSAQGDLRLRVGSPAVGRASVVPEVKRDATGACRSELNIGAY